MLNRVKRDWSGRLRVLTLCAWLGLCGGAGAQTAGSKPVQGGTLQFGVVPEAATIVAIDNTFGFPQKVGTKVVEGLLAYDFEFKPEARLATRWQVSPDGLQYRFELRRGVK